MVTTSNDPAVIKNDTERYIWAAYFLFGLLSSLIGDTLILIATFRRDTFKLNKLLVTIIQHVAISDLANAINFLLPTAISLLANAWVLGDALCDYALYTLYSLYPAGMSLIAALTTSKCLILKYPLRAASWSRKRVHLVCCSIWAFAMMNSVIHLAVDKGDIKFEYKSYNCEYKYTKAAAWKYLNPIIFFGYGVIPNIVIVVTAIPTLKYLAFAGKSAKQVKKSVSKQGALTVGLTAVVYCISTLPFPVYQLVMNILKKKPETSFLIAFHRVIFSLLMVNIISNFYIYVLTIRTFRRFLLSKVKSVGPVSLQTSRNSALASTGKTPKIKTNLLSFHRRHVKLNFRITICLTCAMEAVVNYHFLTNFISCR